MAFENIGTEVPFEDEALGWDSTISNEGADTSLYRLLPEGKYPFTVQKFDRAMYNGSDKMPKCPEADLTILVHDKDGDVEVKDRLFLTKKTEWKLSQFFIAIGQKKHGEPLKMDWMKVPGATGWLELDHRQGTGKYADKEYNQIKKYLDPDTVNIPAEPAKANYTAGKF